MKWFISLSILLLSGLGISYQAYADDNSSSAENPNTGFSALFGGETLVFESLPAGKTPGHSEIHVLTLEEPELNDLDSDTDSDDLEQLAYVVPPFYAATHHYFAFRTQKSLPFGHFSEILPARSLYVLFRVFRI